MAQSKEALNRVSVTRVTSALSNGMMATGARGGAGTSWRQDCAGGGPAGRRKPGVTASASDLRHGDCLSDGNSSFNMRYGVPVKLMAQRKHILDEQHYKEVELKKKNKLARLNETESVVKSTPVQLVAVLEYRNCIGPVT